MFGAKSPQWKSMQVNGTYIKIFQIMSKSSISNLFELHNQFWDTFGCYAMSCDTVHCMLCYVMLCCIISRHVMLYYVLITYVATDKCKKYFYDLILQWHRAGITLSKKTIHMILSIVESVPDVDSDDSRDHDDQPHRHQDDLQHAHRHATSRGRHWFTTNRQYVTVPLTD